MILLNCFTSWKNILFIQIIEKDTKYSSVNLIKILMKSVDEYLIMNNFLFSANFF